MNILTDTLPDFVDIGGVKYKVLTDFRIWMEFDRIMHLKDISAKDKAMMVLKLCIDKEKNRVMPGDAMDIMSGLCEFYLCGKKRDTRRTKNTERVIDYAKDSACIYSAFLTQYGIDLLSIPYMHWYVFCALFEGLEEPRMLIKIMKIRASNPEDVQNAEKRKYLKRMKEFYSVSDTENACEDEIADVLFGAF